MAKAPSPGRVERMQEQGGVESPFEIDDEDAAAEERPHILEMVVGGKTLVVDFDELGPADDTYSRAHIGVAITAVAGVGALGMGMDVVLMLMCIGRRKNGEPQLTYERVVSEVPTAKALNAALDFSDPANPPIGWLTSAEAAARPE